MTDLCAYNFRKMILEAINVSKKFKDKNALSEVTVSVAKGSAFGLLGPNGAGKTTLIRCATNITKFDSGQILLNGKEVSEKEIMKIGYLPEERGLYKDFGVEEQIVYLSRLKGLSKNIAKERCRFWLKKLDLLNTAKRKTGSLSKGMQQKIQFIVAVIHEPSLLILDEPCAGLDPEGREQILTQVKNYHKETGSTVILVSHSMEDIANYADKVLVMEQGRVYNYDMTESIFRDAENLSRMGLGIPDITKVFLKLKEMGVDIGTDVYTIPYAVTQLMKYKQAKEDAKNA